MSEVLVLFGFVWILASALIGLMLAGRHEPHVASLDEMARRGDLVAYHRALDAYKWRVTVHAHGMLFALVAIVIGFAMPKMAYSPLVTDGLAIAVIAAAAGWTIAGFKSIKLVMGLADLLFVAAILTTIVGLARAL